MRPVSPFRSWYPDVRAVRLALASVAIAGLVVVGACTDSTDKALTAPGLRKSDASSGHEGSSDPLSNAGKVKLCVDPASPVGDYVFTYSNLNDQAGLQGNELEDGGYWTDLGGDWMSPTPPAPSQLNDGSTTVFSPSQSGATIHNNGTIGTPDCVLALERTVASQAFRDEIAAHQNAVDTWSGMTLTAASNNVVGGAHYTQTNCTLDLGVIHPQRAFNPMPAAYSAATTYAIGDYATTDNNPGDPISGRQVWRALTSNTGVAPAEGANWTNKSLSDCNDKSNPTRAFANFEHGTIVTFAFAPDQHTLADCVLGYPYGTAPALTTTLFNESEVLTDFQIIGGKLHMWYSDEHALTLGVDSVFVKNKTPPTPNPSLYFGNFNWPGTYAIETMVGHANPLPSPPNPVNNTTAGVDKAPGRLLVGRTSNAANPAGIANPFDGAGRPLFPALFLTDVFGHPDNLAHNDATHRAHDWQYGGTAVAPNAVYGTWKGATIVVDNTKNPSVTSITPGADPAKNHKVVGLGGVAPDASTQDFGYTADVVWDISTLGLTPGHPYRAQFMVHDGDQNKGGGDVGEACVIIQ